MKLKKILFSPAATIFAFVLAAALLLFSTVGGARAALNFYSETYLSQVNLYDIGVTLIENGNAVAWKNYGQGAGGQWNESGSELTLPSAGARLLAGMLPEGEKYPQLNTAYPEAISAGNSGTINQYVRVTVYRYWADAEGNKRTDLDPGLIDLHLVNQGDHWLQDESAATEERMVFYYNRLLPSGQATEPLSDTLTLDGHALKAKVREEQVGDGTYKLIYDYDGVQFVLEARVDAIQENNAQAAALSAWGRNVIVDESQGTLALG